MKTDNQGNREEYTQTAIIKVSQHLCFQHYLLCLWVFWPHDVENTPSTITYYRSKLNLDYTELRTSVHFFISLNFNYSISTVKFFPKKIWGTSGQNSADASLIAFSAFQNLFIIHYLIKWNKIKKKNPNNIFWKTKFGRLNTNFQGKFVFHEDEEIIHKCTSKHLAYLIF